MDQRTLSIGGATYDLFVQLGKEARERMQEGKEIRFPLGGKIRVDQLVETCGGGASNTSVGLKRLGCDAGFLGFVGSDQWGQRLMENFDREGVDTSCVTVVEGETSSFSIILSVTSGERVILYEPGTNSHLHDATFDRDTAQSMDWIYLNHIHEHSCVIEDDLVAILEANHGPRLTWNPGGCHLKTGMDDAMNKHVLANTDLLLLNKEEALEFTKAATIRDAMRSLIAAGTTMVCITDGGEGSYGATGTTFAFCPCIQDSDVVDTTGAGDAFGTGATWALLHGSPLPTVLLAGTINATSVLGALGAQAGLLTDIALRRKLTETSIDVRVETL